MKDYEKTLHLEILIWIKYHEMSYKSVMFRVCKIIRNLMWDENIIKRDKYIKNYVCHMNMICVEHVGLWLIDVRVFFYNDDTYVTKY